MSYTPSSVILHNATPLTLEQARALPNGTKVLIETFNQRYVGKINHVKNPRQISTWRETRNMIRVNVQRKDGGWRTSFDYFDAKEMKLICGGVNEKE